MGFFSLREFPIMSIDFLLLSCLKFKLKKRDKNVLNAKKSKSADFTVLFFSLIFETCFPFPDVRNLHDWTELVWYFIEERVVDRAPTSLQM